MLKEDRLNGGRDGYVCDKGNIYRKILVVESR
jgi:hypothetical protein